MSATVDVGIDLGTTNSAVAVLRGVDTVVLKNNDGDETTPSAVWVDRRGRRYVGRPARDRAESDPGNTGVEFKLQMGTAGPAQRFATSGITMTPEELSAEVLTALRGDVRQHTGEEIDAAVVTVPAAFDLNACEATRRAARRAGLVFSPLLQEPMAAALAYGFQEAAERALWLVYDLGGGTFDAAVVQLREGEFTAINHRGDNALGGKIIDWRIVEELLVPAVVRQAPAFRDLARGNPAWRTTVAKLKLAAETAKIRLSRAEVVDVLVELDDGAGHRLDLDLELRRTDVESLAEPVVTRSVNLCRRALAERDLGPADVEKVILVGGPTIMPYLRERLADPVTGLGVPLEHRLDPMTVVARGAAVFAGTQRRPEGVAVAPPPGTFRVQLEYRPIGPDPEPLVAGRVTGAAGAELTGFSVELVAEDSRTPWRSGRIRLAESGLFAATLLAEPGRSTSYRLELTDESGVRHDVTPARLTYTVGTVENEPLLTHAVGVGLHDNTVAWLVERGAGLPARRTVTLRTTTGISPGRSTGLIRIPVLEGENRRADRNRRIGRLQVVPAEIDRPVPEGSEVVVTVEVDASRLVTASAYVPLLDRAFDDTIDLSAVPPPDPADLAREAGAERQRLADVRERNRALGNPVADAVLARIDDEGTEHDVAGLVAAAGSDPDAATTAHRRMLDLRVAVDEADDELAWPELVAAARDILAQVRDIANASGDETDRSEMPWFEAAVAEAVEARDTPLLLQRMDQLKVHGARILDRSGVLQVMIFQSLVSCGADMTNPALAARLFDEGHRALAVGDHGRLRSVNAQLSGLLPAPPPPPDPFSTVAR
jgi:molecular chaperone DnaK